MGMMSPHHILHLNNFASQKQFKPPNSTILFFFSFFFFFCTVLLCIPVKAYTIDLKQTGSSFKVYGTATVNAHSQVLMLSSLHDMICRWSAADEPLFWVTSMLLRSGVRSCSSSSVVTWILFPCSQDSGE